MEKRKEVKRVLGGVAVEVQAAAVTVGEVVKVAFGGEPDLLRANNPAMRGVARVEFGGR
jgi:hypothetical protein